MTLEAIESMMDAEFKMLCEEIYPRIVEARENIEAQSEDFDPRDCGTWGVLADLERLVRVEGGIEV